MCWRFSKKIRAHRQEFINGPKDRLKINPRNVYFQCFVSLLPVFLCAQFVLVKAADYFSLGLMILLLKLIPFIAVLLHRFYPSRTRVFQIFSTCISVYSMSAISLLWTGRTKHEEVLSQLNIDYHSWFLGSLQGISFAIPLTMMILWKIYLTKDNKKWSLALSTCQF